MSINWNRPPRINGEDGLTDWNATRRAKHAAKEERRAMSRMPYLHSHTDALHRAKTITPMRNGKATIPLGPRKKAAHFNMVVRQTEDVGVMVWGNERITYCADGVIRLRNNPGFPADQTGIRELREVLGSDLKIHDHKTWVELREGWMPIPREGLAVRRLDNGELEFHPSQPDQYPKVWRINRQGMKAMRGEYASFRRYASATIKLKGEDGITTEDWRVAWGVNSEEKLQCPLPFDDKPTALELLSMARGDHGSSGEFTPDMMRYRAFVWVWRKQMWRTDTPVKDWMDEFDEVLIWAHPDVALQQETVKTGKLFVDRYRKFTRSL